MDERRERPGDDLRAPALELTATIERLRRAGGELWRRFEDAHDLNASHAMVLEAVAGGARQVRDVATFCSHHVSSASRLVDQLVTRGLLDRSEDPEDRRQVVLALTAEGRRAVGLIQRFHAERIEHALGALPRAERFELVRLLGKFASGIEAETQVTPTT